MPFPMNQQMGNQMGNQNQMGQQMETASTAGEAKLPSAVEAVNWAIRCSNNSRRRAARANSSSSSNTSRGVICYDSMERMNRGGEEDPMRELVQVGKTGCLGSDQVCMSEDGSNARDGARGG